MSLEAAVRALQARDWGSAATICRSLIESGQPSPDAYHLLGIALGESNQLLQALEAIQQAIRLQPDSAVYRASLALTFKRAGELDQSAEAYAQALSLAPTQSQWLYQLGLVHAELGRGREAEEAFRQALKQQPGLVDANAALARLYEAQGAWEKAKAKVREVLSQDPANVSAKLTLADLLLREHDHSGVQVLSTLAADQSAGPADRAIAYGKLGKHLDREQEYQRAWDAFTAGNSLLLQRSAQTIKSVYGREQIAILRRRLELARWRDWIKVPDSPSGTPVFLVGFPRSGTTLLERMLASHPAISQLDEKDTLRDALELLGGPSEAAALERWDDETITRLRADYWNRVDHHLGRARRAGEVVVDKLPLNSLHLELIYRLFPRAKILFAIRDPRDVCLSCFMQSFGLNDAMANFLSVDTTVRYYVEAMSLALALREALPLNQLAVRYEQLVQEPATQLRLLLEFLHLPWADEVLRFHDAHAGEVTNTPSYQQVRQPLYASSIGRWRHYEDQIADAFDPLAPFIDALGYEQDSNPAAQPQ